MFSASTDTQLHVTANKMNRLPLPSQKLIPIFLMGEVETLFYISGCIHGDLFQQSIQL